MTSGDGGLNPSAVAGGPSVTRLTHSKCMALNGSGKPHIAASNMAIISPMLQLIKKLGDARFAFYEDEER